NPLDFYFWDHLKTIVHSTQVNTVHVLQERTSNGFETIRRILGIFERVRNILRRAIVFVETRGGHFERFL
ncbi:hypothetical protein WN55_10870, partial [Dufourea novaeangliae]